jgi:hypothetical protein
MNLKQIKNLNKAFNIFSTFNDFYNYLKSLADIKKLNIQKEKDKLSIINREIKIDLIASKKDLEINIKDIYEELINIKEKIKEIDIIKKENIELKKRIDILEKDNQKLNIENKSLKNEIKIILNDQNKNKAEKISTEIFNEIKKDFPSLEEIISKNEVIEKLLNNNFDKQKTKKEIEDEINYPKNTEKEEEKIYYKLCKRNYIDISKSNKNDILEIIRLLLFEEKDDIYEFFKKVDRKDNIDYQRLYQMSVELENVYAISQFLEMIEVLNKIIELNYDEAKINDWIENILVNG